MKEEIFKKRFSTYVGDLINKFFTFETHKNANNKDIIDDVDIRCPVWAFVEIISFGTFINLYEMLVRTIIVLLIIYEEGQQDQQER